MKNRLEGKIYNGSGNVFADLQLENPGELTVKARLASKIYDRIEEKGWTQKEAAKELGISQPDVSRLVRGILGDFSVERLMQFLVRLRYEVTIQLNDGEGHKEEIFVFA